MKNFKRSVLSICACILATLAVDANAARQILVEVGGTYVDSGFQWSSSEPNYAPGANTGAVPIQMDFGDGLGLNHLFEFDPAGRLAISDGTGSFSAGYFIAPLQASAPYSLSDPFSSFMRWGAGKVDPTILSGVPSTAPFLIANALDVYRFTWSLVCQTCTGSDTQSFQVLLIDRKNGDFDLDFAYGFGTSVGQFGFALGPNQAPLEARTYVGPVGPDYCFRDGVGSVCGSVVAAVPEPETVTLMLGGLGLLGVAARRRRSLKRSI